MKGVEKSPYNSLKSINTIEDVPMIDCKTLKRLIVEVYSANPYTPVKEVVSDVEKLADYQNVFPSGNDSKRYDLYRNYYVNRRLSPLDRENVNHIIWQLIRENLLVIDKDRLN